jgi:hypothetical protein
MDEGTATAVDQPAAIVTCSDQEKLGRTGCSKFPSVFGLELVIMVHCNTSIYIMRNEVEPRLGTFIEVFARNIYLTLS